MKQTLLLIWGGAVGAFVKSSITAWDLRLPSIMSRPLQMIMFR